MLHNFCDFATDYQILLRTLKDPLQLRAYEKIIQFPFAVPITEEKTEEELARIAEKRKEQGRKLQELAAKSRMEKVRPSVDGMASYILISISYRHNRRRKTCNIY